MTAGELMAACVLDAVVGDPRWFPHPVRLMGQAIWWYERRVRGWLRGPHAERAAGVLLALGLPTLVYASIRGLLGAAAEAHATIGTGATVVLAFTTLAARDLADHARMVSRALDAGSLDSARTAVARIVARDTGSLSEPEVVRATVETIAESMADGVIAPLFYLTLGGPALALAYKAINTLDSMVGHMDASYRHLGWASARLDDVANWIPARLTAVLLLVAAGCQGLSMARAWHMLRRDGSRHPSPNSGRPEAAMAGALGVQLGGTNFYGGVRSERPRLGDPVMPLQRGHISAALRLMLVASAMAVALAVLVVMVRP